MTAGGELVHAGTGTSPWVYVAVGILVALTASSFWGISEWMVARLTARWGAVPDGTVVSTSTTDPWPVGADPFLEHQTCPECKGDGGSWTREYDANDEDHLHFTYCWRCRGLGTVPLSRRDGAA